MYTNARYCTDLSGSRTSIRCDINGVTSFVPLDPANADYQNLFRLQEEGKIVIAPASNEV
jgi:hypothetical protein